MDTVFLDTSVFISENILNGKRLQEIFRLAKEGHIQLVLPIITYREILNRIRKNTSEALAGYKSFRDKTRIIRNIPALEKRFDPLDEEACIKEIQNLFEEKIKSVRTIVIDYPTMNINLIFEKYFDNLFPFSIGEKKNEFPDAFALSTLETWCAENKRKCLVIVGDKDISNYKSKHLLIIDSLGKYLDQKLRKLEQEHKRQKRIELATQLFENKRFAFQNDIKDWLIDQLRNERNYRRFTHYDIHDIDVKQAKATLDEFQIVSVADHSIVLRADAILLFEVSIEIDDESSSWFDEDTRDWQFSEVEQKDIAKMLDVPVAFEVDIPLAGDEYMDIKIMEINNGKDFEL